MTYRSFVGAPTDHYRDGPVDYPQTWMMLDIAALQHLYGADFTTNAGDTTYSWNPATGATSVDGAVAIAPAGNRVFLTLWDGGGTDTYDLSAYATDLAIDLRPGESSTFSAAQLADLGGGPNGGDARGNLFNALQYQGDTRSLIENASGGSGDDLIRGNGAKNQLAATPATTGSGLDGADRLSAATATTSSRRRRRRHRSPAAPAATASSSPRPQGRRARPPATSSPASTPPAAAKGDLIDLSGDRRPRRPATATRPSSSAAAARATSASSTAADATLVCADTGGSSAWDFVLRIADSGQPRRGLHRRRLHPLSAAPADQVLLAPVEVRLRHQHMPGLAAEMREVDPRRRVVRQHPQHRARRERPPGACAP